MAVERSRSLLEEYEIALLRETGTRVKYHESLHSQRYTNFFVKTFGSCLDYSSLSQVKIPPSPDQMRSHISIKGCICPSLRRLVRPSQTSWISEKWGDFIEPRLLAISSFLIFASFY